MIIPFGEEGVPRTVPRRPKCRRVAFLPNLTFFKPAGIPLKELEEEHLRIEELEAIRLKDLERLEQEACAEQMGVSRPTFQRIITIARHKLARALVEGKAIRIEGGNYKYTNHGKCRHCGYSPMLKGEEDNDIYQRKHHGTKHSKCPRCGKYLRDENT
jgi:predicted DNA-binding protein (UPF0251 family)